MSYRITSTEDAEGRTVLRYSGDAQAIVDACAERVRGQREHGKFSAPRDVRKILSLDPIVMMQIAREHGLPYNAPQIFEIAKGRDYSKFRCVEDTRLFKDRSRRTFVGK